MKCKSIRRILESMDGEAIISGKISQSKEHPILTIKETLNRRDSPDNKKSSYN